MRRIDYEGFGPYPGFVNLSFHSGRTRRAKYIAKPSLRPLKMALPELSPERCEFESD